jgi:hypothetical protein
MSPRKRERRRCERAPDEGLAERSGRQRSELDLDDANQEQDHDNDDDNADDPDATIS